MEALKKNMESNLAKKLNYLVHFWRYTKPLTAIYMFCSCLHYGKNHKYSNGNETIVVWLSLVKINWLDLVNFHGCEVK